MNESEMFLDYVKKIVSKELDKQNLLSGEWHLGKINAVISPYLLSVFVDGSTEPQNIPCNPNIRFYAGEEVFVQYINGNPLDKYVPYKRATGTEVSYSTESFEVQPHAATHRTGGIDPLSPSDIGASPEGHTHISSEISDLNETVQDSIGNILTDSSTIDFTYNDTNNQITANVKDNSSNQKVSVSKNNTTPTGTRKQINFKDGTNISITVSDNSTNDAVDVTITNTYIHPTGDGNLHVPATGTTNNNKVLKAGSNAGSLSWGNVDWSELTNKPSSTVSSIDTAVTNSHTHSNKALLDTYTQTEVNLADAVTKKHAQNTDNTLTSSSVNTINTTGTGNIVDFKVNNTIKSSIDNTGKFTGTIDWNNVNNKPSTYTPSAHTHLSNEITDATSANTANMIVKRDASGNFSAGIITATLSGNASTASKLQTARTISLTGDVTGSTSFDGSDNVSIIATVADDSHNHIISNIDGLQTVLDGKSDVTHNHNLANLAERNYTSLVGRPADDDFHTLTELLESANDDELIIYDISDSSYKKITKQNLFAGLSNSSQYVFIRRKEEFTAIEGQTVFNLTQGSYEVGTGRIDVYIWGTKQPPSAYTETSSTSITLTNGVEVGTKVLIEYIQVANVMDYIHAQNHKIGGTDPITPSDIGAANQIHTHIKTDITDFNHTHFISEVTNLQSSLDSKVNISDVTTTATANKILKLDSNAKLPASITGDADTVDGYHASVLGERYVINVGSSGGTRRWIRIAILNGVNSTTGANLEFILSGTGDYGNPNRGIIFVQAGERNDSINIKAWAFNIENTSDIIELYYIDTGAYTFEIWAKLADYNFNHYLTVLSKNNATITLDNIGITAPSSPVQVAISKIWHTDNDGSNSGLDADLLDGKHAPSGDIVGTTDVQTLSNKTLTSPKFTDGGYIADSNGNELIKFSTTSSAVNEITVKNNSTGNNPQIQATGGDTNIGINLIPKGIGTVQVNGVDVVTVSGTQTLTNKTLTTPAISDFTNANHTHTDVSSGGVIDHNSLSNKGENTHAQIDNHISDTTTAHGGVDANSILTKIKTVDGDGSGLDADTIDGYHANTFRFKQFQYVTTTQTTEGWYRVATIPMTAQFKNTIFKVKAYTATGTTTESTITINIAYYSGSYSSQIPGISANTSHSYNSDTNAENGWVLRYCRVSFDANYGYIDLYKYKTTAVTIEIEPLVESDWIWATGALTVNPAVGSYGNTSVYMSAGFRSNSSYADLAGSSTYSNYGVLGTNTLSNTTDKTGQWAYFGYWYIAYNSNYLRGHSGNIRIRLQEVNHDGTKNLADLDDFILNIKIGLPYHADSTAFNSTIPSIYIEIEGKTSLTENDIVGFVYSTSTLDKYIRFYIKLKEANTIYCINPEQRYGRSFATSSYSQTTSYSYFVYAGDQTPVTTLPTPAQGSLVYSIRRTIDANTVNGKSVDDTKTDSTALWTANKIINYVGSAGYGDMLKTVYDVNNNGIVDRAEIADKLTTARNIAISGAVSGNTNFDGSGNITISTTASNTHHLATAKPASDLPSTWPTGMYYSQVYNNGYPCPYGSLLTIKGTSGASIVQICFEWKGVDATIGSAWIRNKRDTGTDTWSAWREFSFTDHNHDSVYQKQITINSTTPSNPINGQLWIDTSV